MDIHFNAYKMRYNTLDNYFKSIFKSQNIKSLNIFISLDDVFHTLHRPLTNNEFQVCGRDASKQLIANILNLIAHYKQWGSRQNTDCKVVCYYTSASANFKNNIYVASYRKKFKDYMDKTNTNFYFINEAIRESYNLLKIISQYIEDIYIIDSGYIEPSAIPFYISEDVYVADWNIIISRDAYDLQYSYMDKWTYISPRGDNSHIINKSNIWDYIASKEKVEIDTNKYDAKLYNFALAIVGDKYRNIPRLKRVGWKTLFKLFESQYNEYSSNLSKTTMELLMVQKLVSKTLSIDDINNNLSASNVKLQYENFGDIDKASIDSYLHDIPDIDNLQELNKIYFSKYPINMVFLTDKKREFNKPPVWK